VALVGSGSAAGEVLAIGELGILGSGAAQPVNFRFWGNLAQYARTR
jgi:hypothetical protein